MQLYLKIITQSFFFIHRRVFHQKSSAQKKMQLCADGRKRLVFIVLPKKFTSFCPVFIMPTIVEKGPIFKRIDIKVRKRIKKKCGRC